VALAALPAPAEKAAAVRAMFDRIAPRYDRLNAVLTWRLDRRWRRAAVAAASLAPGDVAVDVACGTGDLAELAAAAGARVLAVDFAAGMLAGARARRIAARLVRADATALPVASASTDAVTCGFALRNFVAIPPVLAEAARVLRPGGRLVLLEVATPRNPLVRWGHRVYFTRVVPRLGALLADPDAYAYLPASVAYLPTPDALRAMVARAGFTEVSVRALSAGAVQLVRARRAGAA
jgi:demethylmenaquinone methyltransferase / 2-methoxy-6-polyprenyl-1,4-benzoquinol methylase